MPLLVWGVLVAVVAIALSLLMIEDHQPQAQRDLPSAAEESKAERGQVILPLGAGRMSSCQGLCGGVNELDGRVVCSCASNCMEEYTCCPDFSTHCEQEHIVSTGWGHIAPSSADWDPSPGRRETLFLLTRLAAQHTYSGHHSLASSLGTTQANLPAAERGFFFFLHIPKTAGMSLYALMLERMARTAGDTHDIAPECVAVPPCQWSGTHVERLDPNFAPHPDDQPLYDDPVALAARMAGQDALAGHCDYTVAAVLARYRQSMQVVTLMRRPVARIRSLHRFLAGNTKTMIRCFQLKAEGRLQLLEVEEMLKVPLLGKNTPLNTKCSTGVFRHRLEAWPNAQAYQRQQTAVWKACLAISPSATACSIGPNSLPLEVDLAAFVAALPALQLDNYMTRVISGLSHTSYLGSQKQRRISDQDMLRLAKANLDSFAFVGLTERYQESIRLLQLAMGDLVDEEQLRTQAAVNWNQWSHQSDEQADRKATDREPAKPISPSVLEDIEQLEWMDLQLYDHAAARFEKTLADDAATRSNPLD